MTFFGGRFDGLDEDCIGLFHRFFVIFFFTWDSERRDIKNGVEKGTKHVLKGSSKSIQSFLLFYGKPSLSFSMTSDAVEIAE